MTGSLHDRQLNDSRLKQAVVQIADWKSSASIRGTNIKPSQDALRAFSLYFYES